MGVVGVDPSGRSTGLAYVTPTLVELVPIIMYAGDPERSYRDRIMPALARWQPQAVGIEKTAGRARKDTNHGPQAALAEPLGYLRGLIAHPYVVAGMRPIYPDPGEWRRSLQAHAMSLGVSLPTPSRRSLRAKAASQSAGASKPDRLEAIVRDHESGGYRATWERCGCAFTAPDLVAIMDKPDACPSCAGAPPVDGGDIAKLVRAAWKSWACEIVHRLHPEPYSRLVTDARSRARTAKDDHQLSGVSDACEAFGIAIHTRTA